LFIEIQSRQTAQQTSAQTDIRTTYEEAKTLTKMTYHSKWAKEHSADDAYYQLNREDQVIIFRLHTGHNRLKYHLYNKFRIGQNGICTCGTSRMTGTHTDMASALTRTKQAIWRGA
jgi:hypothetical protein